MATILHKRNAGAGITPELEELTLGELAINTVDGKVFTKINNGSESIIEIGGDGEATSELEPYADGWRLNGWELDPGPDGLRLTTGVRSLDFTYFATDINCGAPGDYSMAVGVVTEASGYGSLSTGYATKATGDYSRAGGAYSIASGEQSHAEGYFAESIGVASHAEGVNTYATGVASHAEGEETDAQGIGSHASGYRTIAQNDHMFVCGQYNDTTSTDTLFAVGVGEETLPGMDVEGIEGDEPLAKLDRYNRKNGLEVYDDGRVLVPELEIFRQQDPKSLVTKEHAITSWGNGTEVRIASIVKISQADYDAIANKELDKLYIIINPSGTP